jgi:hypothetical protein
MQLFASAMFLGGGQLVAEREVEEVVDGSCNDGLASLRIANDQFLLQISAFTSGLTTPPANFPVPASCSAVGKPGKYSVSCASFGRGIGKRCDCAPILSGVRNQRMAVSMDVSIPQAGHVTWAVDVPEFGLALCDEERSMLTMWANNGTFVDVALAPLTGPVGAIFFDKKVYVACFGSWGVPGTAGLAVVDPFTGNVDATHAYKDGSFVHNVYAFTWEERQEIFVTVLGNPWWPTPVAGDGLVRFDRKSSKFVPTTLAPLNARSAVQQSSGIFYVLTQEANMGATRLVRLEKNTDSESLRVAASIALPDRAGGDGGADVFLDKEKDGVFCTDRTNEAGKLYYYTYASGTFHLAQTRNTGSHPRYTAMLDNGDVVACNKHDSTLTIFKGLGLAPTSTDIKQMTISTVRDVSFFMTTN